MTQVTGEKRGIVIVGGGLSLLNYLERAKPTTSITVVMGCGFLEWPMASTYFLAKPEVHDEFLCCNPEKYQKKGLTYLVEVAEKVKPEEKMLICASGKEIPYQVLIVATGMKLPLLMPTPGQSLDQRKQEIQTAGAAIRNAKTVVVGGGGATGLELAGDIRLQYPNKKVVILSRSGDVLSGTHPHYLQKRAAGQLQKMNIDIVRGSVDALHPIMEKGSLEVKGGDVASLDFDVYLPSFMQGPNTAFLEGIPGVLNDKKQIQVNEFLQSKAHKEIFTIGCGDVDEGFIAARKLQNMAKDTAVNVAAFLAGKPMKAHKDAMPAVTRPPMIKIGHGPGGYMWFDMDMMPLPAKCCSCWGAAGFPFCPPPCCWCCCKGSCMKCCGECGGEATARFWFHGPFKMIPLDVGYLGMGEPPEQQKMS
mmetsp:Transcript_100834/g.280881  ORF Transcript_100834/g.280881 Transcript_100834/m.280881 type:complete len:419 (-) Transcript_100834:389-1645(-)